MKKQVYYLFIFLLFATSVKAQELRDSISGEPILFFVEIYSDQGDLLGRAVDGKIDNQLFQKILDSKTSSVSFVQTFYQTKEVSVKILKNQPIVELSPLVIALQEVVVSPNNNNKYLRLTAYFRSLQINNERPHYYMDGLVEYYINTKSGKVTANILCNSTFENRNIKQIKEGTTALWFQVSGIPDLEYALCKNIRKNTLLPTNDSLIIKDKKQNSIGYIFPIQNNINAVFNIHTENNPKKMGGFGVESILYHHTTSAIYNIQDVNDCATENLMYYKESRSYNIKQKKDTEYQKVDVTHEIFVLDYEFTDSVENNSGFYRFSGSKDTEDCNRQINNPYYQNLPESITNYIKMNLTECK